MVNKDEYKILKLPMFPPWAFADMTSWWRHVMTSWWRHVTEVANYGTHICTFCWMLFHCPINVVSSDWGRLMSSVIHDVIVTSLWRHSTLCPEKESTVLYVLQYCKFNKYKGLFFIMFGTNHPKTQFYYSIRKLSPYISISLLSADVIVTSSTMPFSLYLGEQCSVQ